MADHKFTTFSPQFSPQFSSQFSPRQDAELSLDQSDTLNTPHQSMSSMGSLTEMRSPRTPRRSITPKQAMDALQLGITQANDIQHVFERYAQQIDQQTINVRLNIDKQFDQIITDLLKRKDVLHHTVTAWKTQQIQSVNTEMTTATDYEQTLLNAQKRCNDILNNDKLDMKQKKNEIRSLRKSIKRDPKYRNSKNLTKYINELTTLIDINYPNTLSLTEISKYGHTIQNQNNAISVPSLQLLTPIKVRESKNGYKIKLKWTTTQPLIAGNFIVRCLTVHTNNNSEEEKQHKNDTKNEWKSLIFSIEKINMESTEFEATDIDSVFLFDKTYILRVEYHISDPVNLLIGSNEQTYVVENKPPESSKADLIDLEYVNCKGYAYEGHPKYLLMDDKNKWYRSKPNKEFNYKENDWIVYKLKHSGFVRTFLPKAVVIKNCSGTQGLKELCVSIGSESDGSEWCKYDAIELESGDDYQQVLLEGVDWRSVKDMRAQFLRLELVGNHGESRGAQCRFKVNGFMLYGLEFK